MNGGNRMILHRINGSFMHDSENSFAIKETTNSTEIEEIVEAQRSVIYYYEFLSTYLLKTLAEKEECRINLDLFLSDIDNFNDKVSFYYYAKALCELAKAKNSAIDWKNILVEDQSALNLDEFDIKNIDEIISKIYKVLLKNKYCQPINNPTIEYLIDAIVILKNEIEKESLKIVDFCNKADDLNSFVSFVNKMKGIQVLKKQCVAIITANNQTFFAISGIDNDIYSKELHEFLNKDRRDKTRKAIRTICDDLGVSDWKWCHLSTKVLRYIEAPQNKYGYYNNNSNLEELIMLKRPSSLKDFLRLVNVSVQQAWKRHFSCAERKILAKAKAKDMIVYSKYPPCIGCQPALIGAKIYAYNGEVEEFTVKKINVSGYPFRCYTNGDLLIKEVD